MDNEAAVDEMVEGMNRFASVLLTKETLGSVLDLVLNIAEKTVSGADGVSVTMIKDGRYSTASHSHEWVKEIDVLQYENGDGPCIAAAEERKLYRIDDLAIEERWRDFCKAACAEGVKSVLSIPFLPLEEPIGALNVYARAIRAFDDVQEQIANLLAQQAAIVLANSQAFTGAAEVNEQLKVALMSRDVIGQAKGIIMEREGVDADRAFSILKAMSQRANRKLREIAQDVADSVANNGDAERRRAGQL